MRCYTSLLRCKYDAPVHFLFACWFLRFTTYQVYTFIKVMLLSLQEIQFRLHELLPTEYKLFWEMIVCGSLNHGLVSLQT